jgi:hypothetical protein
MKHNAPRPRWVLLMALLALANGLAAGFAHAEECDRLKLALRPSEPTLPLHAPVFATLEILNEGTEPATVDLGKNLKGNIRLVFTLPDGRTVNAPPYTPPPDGIFVPGLVVLRPGAPYTQQLLLNEWQELALTGRYRVVLRVEPSPKSCIAERRSADEAVLEISPRDDARLAEICNRLASVAGSLKASAATAAAEGLSVTGDEACVPALVRVLKGDARGRSWALIGLAKVGSKEAVAAVVGEWHRFDEFDQAEALRAFISSGKGDALRAALAKDKTMRSKPP